MKVAGVASPTNYLSYKKMQLWPSKRPVGSCWHGACAALWGLTLVEVKPVATHGRRPLPPSRWFLAFEYTIFGGPRVWLAAHQTSPVSSTSNSPAHGTLPLGPCRSMTAVFLLYLSSLGPALLEPSKGCWLSGFKHPSPPWTSRYGAPLCWSLFLHWLSSFTIVTSPLVTPQPLIMLL